MLIQADRGSNSTRLGYSEEGRCICAKSHVILVFFLPCRMANKWVALSGFAMSLFVMFLMQWAFALGTVSISLLLYIYIGHTSPGLPPGQADFK